MACCAKAKLSAKWPHLTCMAIAEWMRAVPLLGTARRSLRRPALPEAVTVSYSKTCSTSATCLRARESLWTLLMNSAANMVTTTTWKQIRRESSGELCHLGVLRPSSFHFSTEDISAPGHQLTSPRVQRNTLGRNQRPALTLGGLPLKSQTSCQPCKEIHTTKSSVHSARIQPAGSTAPKRRHWPLQC